MADLSELSRWLVPRRNKVHIAIFIITVLMIPGALKALEPIDMESYDMESPELTADRIISEEFETTEIILGFVVGVREPELVGSTVVPVPTTSDGTPDWSELIPPQEIIDSGDDWEGVKAPNGGILNLSILREIDAKHQVVYDHPLGEYMKPFVNDVTGLQTQGVMSLVDIFRGFMSNESILTAPRITMAGEEESLTDWTNCDYFETDVNGTMKLIEFECLEFDDENLTQDHIDLAASRMAMANGSAFLRWMSLDRGFVADTDSIVVGPVGGALTEEGTWDGAAWSRGRWSASASWLLVQLDRAALEDAGWTIIWKDAHPEKKISFTEEGTLIGGYRTTDNGLVLHPPNYTNETCPIEGASCSVEWTMMHLEGVIRSLDNHSTTLLVGQGVNVEVNRELQSSGSLIIAMIVAILVLLYASLRRVSDVAIVSLALGGALLWMQGLIGHTSSLFGWFGFEIISRSQFSNLLPILVLALGIDDSLHALHRYKEERRLGGDPEYAGEVTISRVGRAIMLTSITTISAFAANLFSDVAALRSFGVEAALGIFSAFILTGIWAPLIRVSFDQWMEGRGRNTSPEITRRIIREDLLQKIALKSGTGPRPVIIALVALLITIPAAWGMMQLEGDFAVEDFLDESSDFAYGVKVINQRFSDEGEPAMMLVEGDVTDPRVYAAIDEFRQNANEKTPGVLDKMTRQPDGNVDILAIDEMVALAILSMAENPQPFWDSGFNQSGCSVTGALLLPDTSDRECLIFMFGMLTLNGVPATDSIPDIPKSIVDLYISPSSTPDPTQVWQDTDGNPVTYDKMLIRFGITSPENFPSMGPGMEELKRDLSPLTNLSSGTWEEAGEEDDALPLTWVMPTGKPIIRFVASDKMQNEMQSSLLLGSLFVFISLMVGFRSIKQSLVTLGPILLVVVWLYGLIEGFGYSLNIVTVTIATISLGVGIDYCIHVTERYREGIEKGENHEQALVGVGGACALALVGSALSDIAGFSIIATSPMGLFNAFGLFSAIMILLSLIASMVLTTAALGLIDNSEPASNVILSLEEQ